MSTQGEPTRVAAIFDQSGRIKPVWFDWGGRKYTVTTINMTWEEKQGAARLLHFSVSVGVDVYGLTYNTLDQRWVVALPPLGRY